MIRIHRHTPARLALLCACACLLLPADARAQLMPLLGGQRAGISSLQFLKIGVGARSTGMADAFIAIADDASALHANPAGIAQLDGAHVQVSHAEWLVDLQHEFLGATWRLSSADVVGLSVTALRTDDMEITTETQPFGTGRYFSYGDVAIGASYARLLTAQFSFGATVRYVEETIDVLKTRAVLIDLGTYYRTGLGSTRFSVVVSNFGGNVSPDGSLPAFLGRATPSYQQFSPPTVFRIGFAMEAYSDDTHRLTTALQLNHPNDNSENLALGAEYAWSETFFARAGYKINVAEESLSAGAGMRGDLGFARAAVDYSYVAFEHLNSVHRISISLSL